MMNWTLIIQQILPGHRFTEEVDSFAGSLGKRLTSFFHFGYA